MNTTGIEIEKALSNLQFRVDERAMFSALLHKAVFEYQCGIYDLVKNDHLSSAAALLRVLFEAHVKGVWLYYCATKDQLVQFKKDSVKSLKKKDKKNRPKKMPRQ